MFPLPLLDLLHPTNHISRSLRLVRKRETLTLVSYSKGGLSIMYDSDIGCTLATFSDRDCSERETVTDVQHECFSTGVKMSGFRCHDEDAPPES